MSDLKNLVMRATRDASDLIDLRGEVEDMEAAYAIQDACVPDLVAAKGAVTGRKIAWNLPALMAQFGLAEPAVASMYSDGMLSSGASLQLADYRDLAIEPELAVILARDIAPDTRVERSMMARSVEKIIPAFEILNRRNARDLPHPPSLVAHNILWSACILGGPGAVSADPMTARAKMTLGDKTVLDGTGTAPQHPLDAALFVIKSFQGRGQTLRKGEVILCGSHLPPMPVSAPGVFEFQVDGFGAVRVEISA